MNKIREEINYYQKEFVEWKSGLKDNIPNYIIFIISTGMLVAFMSANPFWGIIGWSVCMVILFLINKFLRNL